MKRLITVINETLEKAFNEAGFDAAYAKAAVSSRPDLCEYQCNGALPLAKVARKKPIDIANSIAELLRSSEVFSKVETCMPGFINMDVSPAYLASYMKEMAADEHLGLNKETQPKKIIVDYGGANVAKPLHVGHLRSAVIGEALKRIGAALGNEMIGDVHLGDWGLQMGLIIEELKDRHQVDFDIKDLEEIYPAASAKSKAIDAEGKLLPEAEEFKKRALKSTELLQHGDPECMKVWKRIMELSLEDLKKNYDNLNVHFELWKGESDVQKYIEFMLRDFVEHGIAYESKGALVVDIAEEGDTTELPPCIVRKSDGASLYATTDLATLVEREALYQPDAYIYVADLRQNLHYTSFFRVAKKAGIVRPDQSLRFQGFGTMNGKDGKPFKTRAGGVMRLSLLIQDINDKVYEKIRETRSTDEISDEEAKTISKIVGLAALKYGDLSNQAAKDYVFDIDRFTSFEGNTGPYILYTIVRINSVLAKYMSKKGAADASGSGKDASANAAAGGIDMKAADFTEAENTPEGKALSLALARYDDIMWQAWDELAPHKICQYIYEVSNAFNTFYHEIKILSEEDKAKQESYIALITLTRDILTECVHVLGFEVPEKM